MEPDYRDKSGKYHKIYHHISRYSGDTTIYHIVLHYSKGTWHASFQNSSLYGKGPSMETAINDLLDFTDKEGD
jgi:hypothetical protein